MTLTEEDQKALIEKYKDKSREAIENVCFLIDNSKFPLAVHQIYYGIYYMLSALALKYQFRTSKHAQLIGWFNKTYVKTNLVDKKFSKIIQKTFEKRMEGDYNILANFVKEEVEQLFKEMKETIAEIEKLL